MGVFNNNERFTNTHIQEYVKYVNSQIQTGLKLVSNNNYGIQQKRLANVAEGVDSNDAITKHQMEVGLSTKPNPTDMTLVNGRNHMTGDLNLGGNQIIFPGGINMNQKLIFNLDVDLNQDLSFSIRHYPPIYQPPEGVYLLIISYYIVRASLHDPGLATIPFAVSA